MRTSRSNGDVVLSSDVIFIAVKPHIVPIIMKEIASSTPGKLLVSIAAGVTIGQLEEVGQTVANH